MDKTEAIKRSVLYGYRGSIAHGTYQSQKQNPDSIDDRDTLGMLIAPLNNYFGFQHFEQFEQGPTEKDADDIVIYDIRKYFSLLLKSNPNVMTLLWLEPKHYIKIDAIGERILGARDLFSSKKAFHSFTGYAYGQLKRMTHFKFEGYMGEKRKALVDRFGYDTKNAAHLVRLLTMSIEFLTEQRLIVERPDAQRLIEIKNGAFTLQQIQDKAEILFDQARQAYIASKLPAEPDYEGAEKLLMSILVKHFEYNCVADIL